MVSAIGSAVTLLLMTTLAGDRTSAARILGVFPHHGYSHHMVFLPYLRSLADHGHDVHVISNFASSHPRITDINIYGSMPMFNNNVTFHVGVGSGFGIYGTLSDLFSLYEMAKSTEGLFDVPAVRRLLDDRDAAFDLVIAEHFNSEVPLGFAAKYRTPFVLLSSCPILPWTKSLVGQPQQTAYRPSVFSGLSTRMNLVQRLINVISAYAATTLFRTLHRPWSERVLKQHLGVDVSLDEFASSVSLVLVNTHWTINGVSPTVPAVLEVGGIHVKSSKNVSTVSTHIYLYTLSCLNDVFKKRIWGI